jgi:hypothetical protein
MIRARGVSTSPRLGGEVPHVEHADRGHGMRHRKATKKRVGKRADLKMAGSRHSRRATKARTPGAGDRDEGVIDLFVSTYRSLG